jgi:hypothetical protein
MAREYALRDSSACAEHSLTAIKVMSISPISSTSPQPLTTAAARQRAAATPFTSVLKAISDRLTDTVGEGEKLALSLVGLAQQSAPAVGETLILAGGLLDPQINFDGALEAFQDAVHKGLRDEGLDALEDFVLQVDEQGRIVVAENHPDRAAIEKFFREHPELVKQFEQLVAAATPPADGQQLQLRLTLFGPEVEYV